MIVEPANVYAEGDYDWSFLVFCTYRVTRFTMDDGREPESEASRDDIRLSHSPLELVQTFDGLPLA